MLSATPGSLPTVTKRSAVNKGIYLCPVTICFTTSPFSRSAAAVTTSFHPLFVPPDVSAKQNTRRLGVILKIARRYRRLIFELLSLRYLNRWMIPSSSFEKFSKSLKELKEGEGEVDAHVQLWSLKSESEARVDWFRSITVLRFADRTGLVSPLQGHEWERLPLLD